MEVDTSVKHIYSMCKSQLNNLGGTIYDVENMYEIVKIGNKIEIDIPGVSTNVFNLDGFLGAVCKGFETLDDFNMLLKRIGEVYVASMNNSENILCEIDTEFEDKLKEAMYYINDSFVGSLISPIINTNGDSDKMLEILMRDYPSRYQCQLMVDKLEKVFNWKKDKDKDKYILLDYNTDSCIEVPEGKIIMI